MQYRTILLNLNDERWVPKLVKTAASLATASDAHVIGLYVMPSVLPPPEFIGDATNTWLEAQTRFFQEQARRIKLKFEDLVNDSSFTHEWRFDEFELRQVRRGFGNRPRPCVRLDHRWSRVQEWMAQRCSGTRCYRKRPSCSCCTQRRRIPRIWLRRHDCMEEIERGHARSF